MTQLFTDLMQTYNNVFEAKIFSYADTEFFRSILSLKDFETLLKNTRFVENDILIYKNGQKINEADLLISKGNKSDPIINPRRFSNKKLHQYFLTGSTGFKINAIYDFNEDLNDLRKKMAQHLRCNVSVNAYYSPAGSERVLSTHRDGYNILILQISGKKTFHFGEITDEKMQANSKTLTIEEGQALYLPAQLAHHAEPCADNHSLHLTIGLHELKFEDYFQFLMRTNPQWTIYLNKNLPLNLSGDIDPVEFKDMANEISEYLKTRLTDQDLAKQFIAAQLNNSEI